MTVSGTDALVAGRAGVCPAIHARLGRRRAAAGAVVRAARGLVSRADDVLTRLKRTRSPV